MRSFLLRWILAVVILVLSVTHTAASPSPNFARHPVPLSRGQQQSSDQARSARVADGFTPIRVVAVTVDLNDESKYCSTSSGTAPNFRGSDAECTSESDVLTTEKKTHILEAVEAAKARIAEVLYVGEQATEPVIVSEIPCSHISRGVAGDTGVSDADFVLFVSAGKSEESAAWSERCSVDINGRPLSGHVNLDPAAIVWDAGVADVEDQRLSWAILHELIHLLGFDRNYMQTPDWKGPITTVDIESVRGKTADVITSPEVVKTARNYFACDTLVGLELEDADRFSTHWEMRLLPNDLMVLERLGEYPTTGVLSVFTLAALKDSGHYDVDYEKASATTFAQGAGCGFIYDKCNTAGGGKDVYWCFVADGFLCAGEDSSGIARCHVEEHNEAIPAEFQYFSGQPTLGGDKRADYCPLMEDLKRCTQASSGTEALDKYEGNVYGSSSRCVTTTGVGGSSTGLAKVGEPPQNSASGLRCLPQACSASGSYEYAVNNIAVECPKNGGRVELDADAYGYQGGIECPAAPEHCAQPPPPAGERVRITVTRYSTGCDNDVIFDFKEGHLPGIRSFIPKEWEDFPYVGYMPNHIFPAVELVVASPRKPFDETLERQTVEIVAPSSIGVSASIADVRRGRVVFNAFELTSASEAPIDLFFNLTVRDFEDPVRSILFTKSIRVQGVRHVVDERKITRARFTNAGFMIREHHFERLSLPVGVPLPSFSVEALNDAGSRTPEDLIVDVSVVNGSGSVHPATVRGSAGSATLNGLVVTIDSTEPRVVRQLSFKVASTGNDQTSATLTTDPIVFETLDSPARFILFKPDSIKAAGSDAAAMANERSFLRDNNVGGTAVVGVPLPPIMIQLVRSDFTLEMSVEGWAILASCDQLEMSGTSASVIEGVATFRDLAFVSGPSPAAVITFTASPQQAGSAEASAAFDGNVGLRGIPPIYSGGMDVKVAAMKGRYLVFAPESEVNTNTGAILEPLDDRLVSIRRIAVQILDSAGRVDANADGLVVNLRTNPSGLMDNAHSTFVEGGLAAFANVRFRFSQTVRSFTITVSAASMLSGVVPDSITTPPIEVHPREELSCDSCLRQIRFRSRRVSYIDAEDKPLHATIGHALAPIEIELVDFYGKRVENQLTNITFVALTATRPDNEQYLESYGIYGTWIGGIVRFTCVTFKAVPHRSTNIRFYVRNETDGELLYTTLQTGRVTVERNLVPSYGLRFSMAGDSSIEYESQPIAAVVGSVLPQVVVELVDSGGKFYDQASSNVTSHITIVASSRALRRHGSTALMIDGRAIFSFLSFEEFTSSDTPLRFIAYSDRATAVHGKSISTGTVLLTSVPVPSFAPRFKLQQGAANAITGPRVELRNPGFPMALPVELAVVNSAMSTDSLSAARSVVVEVAATGADVAGFRAAYDSTCACFPFKMLITLMETATPLEYITLSFSVFEGNSLLALTTLTSDIVLLTNTTKASSCQPLMFEPTVVVSIRLTPIQLETVFLEERRTVVEGLTSRLTDLLSAPSTRFTIQHIDSANGTIISRAETWIGTKFWVAFRDPGRHDINRVSARDLASQLMALPTVCQPPLAPFDTVVAVEDAHNVKQCDPGHYEVARRDYLACVSLQRSSICDCHDMFLTHDAFLCIDGGTETMRTEVKQDCEALHGADCPVHRTELEFVCDAVGSRATSLPVTWIVIASILGTVIVWMLYRRYRNKLRRGIPTLHTKLDQQYDNKLLQPLIQSAAQMDELLQKAEKMVDEVGDMGIHHEGGESGGPRSKDLFLTERGPSILDGEKRRETFRQHRTTKSSGSAELV